MYSAHLEFNDAFSLHGCLQICPRQRHLNVWMLLKFVSRKHQVCRQLPSIGIDSCISIWPQSYITFLATVIRRTDGSAAFPMSCSLAYNVANNRGSWVLLIRQRQVCPSGPLLLIPVWSGHVTGGSPPRVFLRTVFSILPQSFSESQFVFLGFLALISGIHPHSHH